MNAKRRLKRSLIVGFLASCGLHVASAAAVALFPYSDEPLTPKLVFIYLLLPGWAISGRGYYVKLWQETLAVAINGAVYASVVFCFLTWNSWREGRAPSPVAHRLIAIVPLAALLWLIEALFLGFLPYIFPRESAGELTGLLIWALVVAAYVLYQQLRRRQG